MRTNDEDSDDTVLGSLAVSEGGAPSTHQSLETARDSGGVVREYEGDGKLYAYRDGDEHVVVFEDEGGAGDAETKRVTRVPAERWAVLHGERLWTIPENWVLRVGLKLSGTASVKIYQIPESGVEVAVSQPESEPIADGWYTVESVGETTVTVSDSVDYPRLEYYMSETAADEVRSANVLEVLDEINESAVDFAARYEGYPEDVFWSRFEGTTIEGSKLDSSITWVDTAAVVAEIVNADQAVSDKAAEVLHESGSVPRNPSLMVAVKPYRSLPDGYEVRALLETGSIPNRVVEDQLVMDCGDSLAAWVATCDLDHEIVTEGVMPAEQNLDLQGRPSLIVIDTEQSRVGLLVLESDRFARE